MKKKHLSVRSAFTSFSRVMEDLRLTRALLLSTLKYRDHPIIDAIVDAYERETIMVSLLYRELYWAVRTGSQNPPSSLPSLEQLEMAFIILRQDAENARRAEGKLAHLGGRRAYKVRKSADRLERVTREAARNLITEAHRRGRDTDSLVRNLGLDSWLRGGSSR